MNIFYSIPKCMYDNNLANALMIHPGYSMNIYNFLNYAGKKMDLGIMYQDTKVDENGTEIPLFADTTLEDGRLVFKGWFSNVKGSEDV